MPLNKQELRNAVCSGPFVTAAKAVGKSNCSYCAIGHDGNQAKIWDQKQMDADHVTAWSKGGKTDLANCEMRCQPHNRAKGNR